MAGSDALMEQLESIWEERHRIRTLLVSAAFVLVIAVVDRRTGTHGSLALLYVFPVMLAAGFLPRWLVALLGVACAVLSTLIGALEMAFMRVAFESLALTACGLFAGEWVRGRRLRVEAERRLRLLVETIPAAILLVDEHGVIEMANGAAADLVLPRERGLVGGPAGAIFSELHHAVRCKVAPPPDTVIQCRGHRGNGGEFLAEVRYSMYRDGASFKLAVIVTKAEEEAEAAGSLALTCSETGVLCFVAQGLSNKEIAARMEMSESKVKGILQQLFARTGVRTRAQLVRVALEHDGDLLSEPQPAGFSISSPAPAAPRDHGRLSTAAHGAAPRSEKCRPASGKLRQSGGESRQSHGKSRPVSGILVWPGPAPLPPRLRAASGAG